MAGKGGLISRLSASLSRYFTGKELVGGDFNGNRYYRCFVRSSQWCARLKAVNSRRPQQLRLQVVQEDRYCCNKHRR